MKLTRRHCAIFPKNCKGDNPFFRRIEIGGNPGFERAVVTRAEASRKGAATKVFIELRDVNYPGSTYTLVYVPERDLLAGVYFQAVEQQSFDGYFERLKWPRWTAIIPPCNRDE